MRPRGISGTVSQYDPDAVLAFFDALGVFSELDTPHGSLLVATADVSPPLAPRGAALTAVTSPTNDGAESSATFAQPKLGGVRPPSPIPLEVAHLIQPSGASWYTRHASQGSPLRATDSTEEQDGSYFETHSPLPMRRKKPSKKIPSSQRQREKIEYLRNKMDALKDKLTAIKHEGMVAMLNASGGTGPTPAVLWHALAQRQLAAKVSAEAENASLRTQLKAQLKYVKYMQRVMQKRWVHDALAENRLHLREALSESDSKVFKALKSSVDARACRLDEIFNAHRLTPESTTARHESSFALDEDNRVQVDFVNCNAALFDVSTIASVVWNRLAMTWSTTENVGLITEVLSESSDVRLVKLSVVIPSADNSQAPDAQTAARTVCRRVVEEHRVRFVWETLTECRGTELRGMPPLQLVEKGCGQVFQSSTVSSSGGEGGGSSGGRTMVQSIVSAIPDLESLKSPSSPKHGELVEESKAEASSATPHSNNPTALVQLVILSFQENAESARRAVENQFVDEMLKMPAVFE